MILNYTRVPAVIVKEGKKPDVIIIQHCRLADNGADKNIIFESVKSGRQQSFRPKIRLKDSDRNSRKLNVHDHT